MYLITFNICGASSTNSVCAVDARVTEVASYGTETIDRCSWGTYHLFSCCLKTNTILMPSGGSFAALNLYK